MLKGWDWIWHDGRIIFYFNVLIVNTSLSDLQVGPGPHAVYDISINLVKNEPLNVVYREMYRPIN